MFVLQMSKLKYILIFNKYLLSANYMSGTLY